MRVVGIIATTSNARVVMLEGDPTKFTVEYRDKWILTATNRLDDYVEYRKRLQGYVTSWKPDAVCIEQLDGGALAPGSPARPTLAWFQTSELRGVLAEAARAAGALVEMRSKPTTRATVGSRTVGEYRKDDAFWAPLGKGFLKEFRDPALLALSKMKELSP
jgi:hypothetical protein